MTPHMIEWIGAIAATLTTLSFLPQAIKCIKTQQTRDLSLGAQTMLFFGNFMWLTYGIYLGSWPLIGANIVTIVLVGIILFMKLRHG
jgi:MtN3 and saliva related transmembrane protein